MSLVEILFVIPLGVLFAFVIIANIVIGARDKAEGKTDDVFANIKKSAELLKDKKAVDNLKG